MVDIINRNTIGIIGCFRGDYLRQVHVREMARELGSSHVTLLPHLAKLEIEKILVPKTIGRSKVYGLNLSNPECRDFISLSEKAISWNLLRKEIFIRKVFEQLANLPSVCLILFGSYASGINTDESDIDLLLIGKFPEVERKKLKALGETYRKEVHLTTMSQDDFMSKSALVKEIIKNHVILANHDIFVELVWRQFNGG